ncbi:MAG: hypothetical protein DMD52_00800 [Gemmatimonadetes bacterium]|nr:MAG: hypothetical protein DMD52_00800 [Gemmatimonadota bacterium]
MSFMDLVQQVAANLEIDQGKAEKGIGAVLMALRMSLDPAGFAQVRLALPNCESLMGRALMSGARTGEMAALIGPTGLMAALAAAGYQKDDIPQLGRLVLEHLRPTIGTAQVEKFLQGAPALRG